MIQNDGDISLWSFCVRKQVVHEKLKDWGKVACFHGLYWSIPEAIVYSSF